MAADKEAVNILADRLQQDGQNGDYCENAKKASPFHIEQFELFFVLMHTGTNNRSAKFLACLLGPKKDHYIVSASIILLHFNVIFNYLI